MVVYDFLLSKQEWCLLKWRSHHKFIFLVILICCSWHLPTSCYSSTYIPDFKFQTFIFLIFSGLLARQRRGELQRLNEQLRQINAALRRQAKIESYAPTLSYAPVGRITETEVIVDPRKEELISRLKNGKNFLRNQEPQKAFSEFKTALDLAQNLKDPIEEKKAARGLGISKSYSLAKSFTT